MKWENSEERAAMSDPGPEPALQGLRLWDGAMSSTERLGVVHKAFDLHWWLSKPLVELDNLRTSLALMAL